MSATRPRTASTTTAAVTARHTRQVPSARRRPRSRHGDIALDTATRLLVDLGHFPGHAALLPRGRADNRYTCLACGHSLELCGPREHAEYTARFRHTRTEPDRCPATAQQQALVRAAVTDAGALARQLLTDAPGVRIQVSVTDAEPETAPLLALRLDRPSGAGVVHLPFGQLTEHQVEMLLRGREETGRQWVLFDRSPVNCQPAGHLQARVRRQPLQIDKITPTIGQQKLVQAQFAVAWRDGSTLLLPFGGHQIQHPPRPGEDWSGPTASWQRDWKISHPRPAADADWWGLLPLPLRTLTAPRLLAAAVTTMTDLEDAQSGREAYRRNKAREHHAQVQAREAEPPVQLALPITGDTKTPMAPAKTAGSTQPTSDTPPVTATAVGTWRRGPGRKRWRRLLTWLRRR